MKRHISVFTLILLLVCSLTLSSFAAGTTDHVMISQQLPDFISEQSRSEFDARAKAISEKYNCGVYIIVLEDYTSAGYRLSDVVEDIFDEMQLGYGSDRAAIILTLSMADRSYDLDTHGFVTDYIRSWQRSSIENAFLDDFRNNDWHGGFSDYLDECEDVLANIKERIDAGEVPEYMQPREGASTETAVGIGAAAGSVVSLISCSVMKSQMRSVSRATDASDYTVNNGINLYACNDVFTHTTQTRTRIESSRPSSGGGGGGGGGHSHSGGHF